MFLLYIYIWRKNPWLIKPKDLARILIFIQSLIITNSVDKCEDMTFVWNWHVIFIVLFWEQTIIKEIETEQNRSPKLGHFLCFSHFGYTSAILVILQPFYTIWNLTVTFNFRLVLFIFLAMNLNGEYLISDLMRTHLSFMVIGLICYLLAYVFGIVVCCARASKWALFSTVFTYGTGKDA